MLEIGRGNKPSCPKGNSPRPHFFFFFVKLHGEPYDQGEGDLYVISADIFLPGAEKYPPF